MARAQASIPWQSQDIGIRPFSQSDGLRAQSVYAINVASDGVIWVGTDDQGYRFDGAHWMRYALPGAARGSQVRDILFASDGTTWLATRAGVVRMRAQDTTVFNAANGLGENPITYSIIETRVFGGRTVAVGTYDGMYVLRGERFERIPFPAGYSDVGIVLAETEDAKGQPVLWAGSPQSGMARYVNGKWIIGRPSGIETESIEWFVDPGAPKGPRLYAVGNAGVFALGRDDVWRFVPGSPAGAYRLAVRTDGDSVAGIWVGTRAGRIFRRIVPQQWTEVDLGVSAGAGVLAMRGVTTPIGTKAIYVGLLGGRMVRLTVGRAATLDLGDWRGPRIFNALTTAAPATDIYASANQYTLVRFDGQNWHREMEVDSRKEIVGPVVSRTTPRGEETWVETIRHVFRKTPAGWIADDADLHGAFPGRMVLVPGPGGPSTLAITSSIGLFYRDGEHWLLWPDSPKEGIRYIAGVAGTDGAVWFATDSAVRRWTRSSGWRGYRLPADLPARSVVMLAELPVAGGQAVLVGTAENDVRMLTFAGDSAQVAWSSPARNISGLGGGVLRFMTADARGRVFIGSEDGVARVSAAADPDVPVHVDEAWSEEDGLPGAAVRAAWIDDARGVLLVSTVRGIGIIRLSTPPAPPASAPLRVTVRRLDDGAPVAQNEALGVRTGGLVAEAALAAGHRESDVRYAITLDQRAPSPDAWTAEHAVTFDRVGSGGHVVRVWARDYLGRVSGPASLPFTVLTPLWRRPWAFALYILALGMIFVWWREEQRRAAVEERRREIEQAGRQRIESLGTLAGGIAHDINNVLAAVRGHTELVLHGIARGDDVHVPLREIVRATDRARDLVRQILTFSRRDAPRKMPVDVADLVRDMQGMLRAMIPATVTINADVAPAKCVVLGDPIQLQQLVLNLCANAEHAVRGRPEGALTIAVALTERDGREWVRVRVQDNGVGMSDDVRARALEPFFTTKPAGEGTGLGLAVLHGIVTSLGGDVKIQSAPGAGTTIDVHLPASANGAPPVNAS